MIGFRGVTLSRRGRVVAVLAAVSAGILASGFFVVSSLAAVGPTVPLIGIGVTGLAQGPHCFHVYTVGRAGRGEPATGFCGRTGAAPQDFTVGGSPTSPLYPGTSQRLDLTFTNSGSAPITIPSGGISASNITITSHAPGCASSNFAVTQGLARAVTIPARRFGPASLSALGVPENDWPAIGMIETNTNQDACRGAKLTLTYSRIEAGA